MLVAHAVARCERLTQRWPDERRQVFLGLLYAEAGKRELDAAGDALPGVGERSVEVEKHIAVQGVTSLSCMVENRAMSSHCSARASDPPSNTAGGDVRKTETQAARRVGAAAFCAVRKTSEWRNVISLARFSGAEDMMSHGKGFAWSAASRLRTSRRRRRSCAAFAAKKGDGAQHLHGRALRVRCLSPCGRRRRRDGVLPEHGFEGSRLDRAADHGGQGGVP